MTNQEKFENWLKSKLLGEVRYRRDYNDLQDVWLTNHSWIWYMSPQDGIINTSSVWLSDFIQTYSLDYFKIQSIVKEIAEKTSNRKIIRVV